VRQALDALRRTFTDLTPRRVIGPPCRALQITGVEGFTLTGTLARAHALHSRDHTYIARARLKNVVRLELQVDAHILKELFEDLVLQELFQNTERMEEERASTRDPDDSLLTVRSISPDRDVGATNIATRILSFSMM
jgi:hypothetical protein